MPDRCGRFLTLCHPGQARAKGSIAVPCMSSRARPGTQSFVRSTCLMCAGLHLWPWVPGLASWRSHASHGRSPGMTVYWLAHLTTHHLTNTKPLAAHRPEALRHSSVSPAGAERRGPYRYNLGMRRSPPHAPRPDCQPPVPGHPRPGESRRTHIAGSRHGTDSLMSRARSWPPGSNRRQPALACALGGQIRDGLRISEARQAGISSRKKISLADLACCNRPVFC